MLLFTICGRAGSKGIKSKNVRDFLNVKLPYLSLAAIDLYLRRNPKITADIALNTDSEELMYLMKNNGLRTVSILERSQKLAGDRVGKIEVILDSLERMEKITSKRYDAVIDVDITSPIRKVKDIENLVAEYEKKHCDLVFSVVPSRRNPYFNMVMETEHGYKTIVESNYTARQQAPQTYDMNASLYMYQSDFLKKKMNLFEGHCEIIEMCDTGVLDLDSEADFELMEVIAKYLYDTKPEFAEIYYRAQEA